MEEKACENLLNQEIAKEPILFKYVTVLIFN